MKEDMLFSGESKNIEYKVTVPDKSEKYMKTVVAFANGKGGKIVFGVDDKTLEWMPLPMQFLMRVNQPSDQMWLYRQLKIKR